MIVKKYHANININKSSNYFENWYADVWRRRIINFTVTRDVLLSLLEEEVNKYGATLQRLDLDYKYEVSFLNNAEYTLFVLRWA